MLLTLPIEVRHIIYCFAFGAELKIEINDDGQSISTECMLLRVSRDVRADVFDAYADDSMSTIWAFKSPAAFAHTDLDAASNYLSPRALSSAVRIRAIQLVLLHPLGDGSHLTHEDLGEVWPGPNLAPLYKAWRSAVSALPQGLPLEAVYFDLTHSWSWRTHSVAKLVHNLSVVLHQRTRGAVKFHIVGCKTDEGRRFIENSTVGLAVPSSIMSGKGLRVGAE